MPKGKRRFKDNSWRPDEGDVLKGKVVVKERIRTKFDDDDSKGTGTLTVKTAEDKKVKVWCSNVVLQPFYKEVKKGDKVYLKFLGEDDDSGRNLFKLKINGEDFESEDDDEEDDDDDDDEDDDE